MSWVKQALSSSVGSKALVALTGLGLVGFLVAHLSGNLLIYAGPEAMNAYASGLRDHMALLVTARVGLIVMFVLHVAIAIRLNLANQAARPIGYAKKVYRAATWASRNMVLTGLLLLAYLLYHLAHFTFRLTSSEIKQYGHFDVYQMAVAEFHNPIVVATYVVSMIIVGLHLSHGIQSLFQSLGLNHGKYTPFLRKAGPALGWLLSVGFISIPVSVVLGIVK
jgi:succinate dehydrogenase / fumarate reductase cytochrome b subunit